MCVCTVIVACRNILCGVGEEVPICTLLPTNLGVKRRKVEGNLFHRDTTIDTLHIICIDKCHRLRRETDAVTWAVSFTNVFTISFFIL